MLKSKVFLAVLVAAFGACASVSASANDGKAKPKKGGYSYSPADSINTYGDARSKYGAASSLRDPSLDKQTVAGPFDHGFFFDSATGRHGGDSPYMN